MKTIDKIKNKKQDDRLLKQLPLQERRQQEHIRKLILKELNYKTA
jgi:hypothetical protein